jgi:hypothetical protein
MIGMPKSVMTPTVMPTAAASTSTMSAATSYGRFSNQYALPG